MNKLSRSVCRLLKQSDVGSLASIGGHPHHMAAGVLTRGIATIDARGWNQNMDVIVHQECGLGMAMVGRGNRNPTMSGISRLVADKHARGVWSSRLSERAMPKEQDTERSTSQAHVEPHPGMQSSVPHEGENYTENNGSYWLMQPVYNKEYLESVTPKHRRPSSFHDYTGYYGVFALRKSFDILTGYGKNMTHNKWMTRFLFLETVAGVPGMVGAMLRHLRSLRTMRRDNGWIHTLLEEAENERMHLLTFMQMKNPGWLFRFNVIATQGIFLSLYSVFYALSPRHCHAFVSYLEEEAVKTYTHAVEDYDSGKIPEWKNMEVPHIAKKYWRLDDGSTFRDLLLAIRADEACHNHVNAVFAEMKADDPNPFAPGTTLVQ